MNGFNLGDHILKFLMSVCVNPVHIQVSSLENVDHYQNWDNTKGWHCGNGRSNHQKEPKKQSYLLNNNLVISLHSAGTVWIIQLGNSICNLSAHSIVRLEPFVAFSVEIYVISLILLKVWDTERTQQGWP